MTTPTFSPVVDLRPFFSHLEKKDDGKLTILLGLSGGPDSVFLFYHLLALVKSGTINLIAAHLNHGWRPQADEEQAFCHQLCNSHNIRLVTEHARSFESLVKFNGSQEELGRTLRRIFFEKVAKARGIDYIALAHHADDQIETFFIRLIRGATLQGLVGIKSVDNSYIRPLLHMSKQDILTWLNKNHISYCLDASNQSDKFLRNRIRNQLLPVIEKIDPRFRRKFFDTHHHLVDAEKLLVTVTEEKYQQVFTHSKQGLLTGNLKLLLSFERYLIKRILVMWLQTGGRFFIPSNALLEEIIRFLLSPRGGTHQIGPNLTIIKKSSSFWFAN